MSEKSSDAWAAKAIHQKTGTTQQLERAEKQMAHFEGRIEELRPQLYGHEKQMRAKPRGERLSESSVAK
jgi:hypothetical protein